MLAHLPGGAPKHHIPEAPFTACANDQQVRADLSGDLHNNVPRLSHPQHRRDPYPGGLDGRNIGLKSLLQADVKPLPLLVPIRISYSGRQTECIDICIVVDTEDVQLLRGPPGQGRGNLSDSQGMGPVLFPGL